MDIRNRKNERVKHRYFIHLREAYGRDDKTVDAVAKSLDRFEEHTRYADFGSFRYPQAISFKKALSLQKASQTGKTLSKATQLMILGHLRCFFIWMAGNAGPRSRLHFGDAQYFNLSEKDKRIATTRRGEVKGPTVEQVLYVIDHMPFETDVQLRNRALLAVALATGARDGALASLMLKHIDPLAHYVFQDAREVKTKNSKTFPTWFFPVGDKVFEIITHWVNYLRVERHWDEEDPLFPSTLVRTSKAGLFAPVGIQRKFWSTAGPIRDVFRAAFEAAGLPYSNPHSLRNTLTRFVEPRCTTGEEAKAWCQNLGHAGPLAMFMSYGDVPPDRQREIIEQEHRQSPERQEDATERLAEEIVQKMAARGFVTFKADEEQAS